MRRWKTVALKEDRLEIAMLGSCSALQLVQDLCLSRQTISRVFERGQLTCAGHPLQRGDSLSAADRVMLSFWREEDGPRDRSGGTGSTGSLAGAGCLEDAPPGALCVAYRDPVCMVVDKPAGLLVHGDGTRSDTLTRHVCAWLRAQGSAPYAQAVQRLDVETTGLVLFSLTEEFQPVFDRMVADGALRKRYLAVVEGPWPAVSCQEWLALTQPIGRDRHDARRMRVSRAGKPSLTRVRLLARSKGRLLLLVELGTGRRHQIRVHLAHAGHPIVGDALYGGRRSPEGLMLHAWEERLVHPVTGEDLLLRAPIPDRIACLFPDSPVASAETR